MDKWCSGCKQSKPIDSFNFNRTTADGRASRCRSCRAEYNKRTRYSTRYYQNLKATNPEKIAEYQRTTRLRQRYGITREDFDAMLERQGNRCAICGSTKLLDYPKRPPIDHCHTTGRVRGVLCNKCNGALGWYEKHRETIVGYLDV